MRFTFLLLTSLCVVAYAAVADAQEGRRSRRGGDQGDNQEGGDRGRRFRGEGFPGGPPGPGFQGPGGYPGPGGGYGGPGGGFGGPGGGYGGPGGGFGGPGGGFGGPGGDSASRQERFTAFLQQFDANHDGQIDANEVQALGPRAGMVEGMIRRAGLEPKYPVKISAIQEGMQNARNNWNRGGGPNGPGGPPGGNPGIPPGPGGPPANGDSKSTPAPAPLVPGFGVDQKNKPVPGFGAASTTATTVATSSPASSETLSSSDSPASSPDMVDDSIRKHAEAILKQNDRDHSGSLEKDRGEWAEVRDAEKIDKDHNNLITLEELTTYYLAQNGRHSSREKGKGSANSSASDSSARAGKTYRILSPAERLPEGIPDWFLQKDANGDGQISMAEYARDWSPDRAKEFARYDLNGDGIITPQECLQVEKKK